MKIKPLSVNQAWQGRKFKTKLYKAYEEELLLRLPNHDIPKGIPLKLEVEVGFSNKASDLSNILKPFEDILCKKYGIDDKWNYRIVLDKKIVKKGEDYINFNFSSHSSMA